MGRIYCTAALVPLISLSWFIVSGGSARERSQTHPEAHAFPSFTRVQLLETATETSANVSIGDVNGDGHPDLLLAKGRHWPLINRVLLNDGRGRFSEARNLDDAADRSYSALLVDIDRDGDLDVVVSNDQPDVKRVYANDGKGRFHLKSTFGRPEWATRNAAVADLDGDRWPDIIVANRTGNRGGSNFICFNKGGGAFDGDCLAFASESSTTITPADVDRDGLLDLVVPHRDGGQSYVYLNAGQRRFATRIPFGRADAAIRVAAAADLDGDRFVDIVAIDERRGVFVCFGRPDGSFAAPAPIGDTAVVPYALAVGDLNNDGRVDIVVGHVKARSIVHFNVGQGRRFVAVPFGDAHGTVYGFAIGDLDADGHPDIAVARSDAANVVYLAVPPERRSPKVPGGSMRISSGRPNSQTATVHLPRTRSGRPGAPPGPR